MPVKPDVSSVCFTQSLLELTIPEEDSSLGEKKTLRGIRKNTEGIQGEKSM